MKIQCDSIADFLMNLQGRVVWSDTIYVNKIRHPLNDNNPRKASSFSISIMVTTILDFEPEGQAILAAEVECGVDRISHDATDEGTKQFEHLRERVQSYCSANNLRLLPGVLDH